VSNRIARRWHVLASVVQHKHQAKVRGRVLDVGCGKMPYKRLFYGRPDSTVTEWVGLDVRPVGDVHANVTDMPFEDSSFDTVLCLDVLHLVTDPLSAMKEMGRVLKPGGTMIVCVVNTWIDDAESIWNIKANGLRWLVAEAGLHGEIEAMGDLFSGEAYEYEEWQKYREGISLRGFVGALNKNYPLMSVAVVSKEQANG